MADPPTDSAQPGWLRDHAGLVGAVAAAGLVTSLVLSIVLLGGDPSIPPLETAVTDAPPDATTPSVPAGRTTAWVAVKVDNAPAARPPVGLGSARLVVETPVEGGLTRFLALFEPGDTLVGPVRSARPVDIDLVPAFSDVLVSTGGRPFVLGPLHANGIRLPGADPEASPFQALERPSPHNQFVSLLDVPAPGEIPGGFPAGDWPSARTSTGEEVDVPYPAPVSWTFADGLYTRSQSGETFITLAAWDADPEPFTTETVVVMEVNQRPAGYTDVNGVEVPTYDVIGAGRLWIHHGGETVTGRWARSSLADGYHFRAADGTSVGLPDARTFAHLLPGSLASD